MNKKSGKKFFQIDNYQNKTANSLLWIGRILTTIFGFVIIGELVYVISVMGILGGFIIIFFAIFGAILFLAFVFFYLAYKKEKMGGIALSAGGLIWGAIVIYLTIKYDTSFATWRSWFYTFEPLCAGLFLIIAWYTDQRTKTHNQSQDKSLMTRTKFCSKCGQKIFEDADFCGECGSTAFSEVQTG